MARFWVGTSGWSYSDWRERFYPASLPQRDWLAHYAGRFPTVELNNSFYHQPRDATWDSWRARVPEGFRFAVKAHRYITHRLRLEGCEESLERVLRGAGRLEEKLGPLLFQLPPSFARTDENVRRLDAFLGLLPADLECAFEFRNPSWHGDETMEQLRRRGAAFCSYDMPQAECPLAATARFAYMRFHGSGALYAGNYTDELLREWAGRLQGLSADVDEVYAYFNNDVHAYAVFNAIKLGEFLGAVRSGGPAPHA